MFKLLKQEGNARRGEFTTVHGTVQTPCFMNVATAGAIKGGLSSFDLKDIGYKIAFVFGALIVIYGVLWLLVTLGLIPAIVAAIFPQIVLIIIGIFIMYTVLDRKKKYY